MAPLFVMKQPSKRSLFDGKILYFFGQIQILRCEYARRIKEKLSAEPAIIGYPSIRPLPRAAGFSIDQLVTTRYNIPDRTVGHKS